MWLQKIKIKLQLHYTLYSLEILKNRIDKQPIRISSFGICLRILCLRFRTQKTFRFIFSSNVFIFQIDVAGTLSSLQRWKYEEHIKLAAEENAPDFIAAMCNCKLSILKRTASIRFWKRNFDGICKTWILTIRYVAVFGNWICRLQPVHGVEGSDTGMERERMSEEDGERVKHAASEWGRCRLRKR